MPYIPGHSAWVGYGLEVAAITESADGSTPAALPAVPAFVGYLGYMDVPEATQEFGARKGYAIGSPYPQYDARGNQHHSLTFELKVGSRAFLQKCLRNAAFGVAPYAYGLQPLCLFVGVAGLYTDLYRFAYCDSLAISIEEGSAREVRATVSLQAVARTLATSGGNVKSPTVSQLTTAIGSPLYYHDVRQFLIEKPNGLSLETEKLDYGDVLMGATFSLSHGLERKGIRPDWGDAHPLSRTSYTIMPHLNTVTGEITLHDRLDEDYFTGAIRSQSWGDIVIPISDAGSDPEAVTPNAIFDLTIRNVIPATRVNKATEASGQLSHTVSVLADDIEISTTRA